MLINKQNFFFAAIVSHFSAVLQLVKHLRNGVGSTGVTRGQRARAIHLLLPRRYALGGLSHGKSVCPSVTLVDCAHQGRSDGGGIWVYIPQNQSK